ncbi:MAG: ABC transporter ATP-binding protein [Methanophagales archaeon ANME-1-THS]|nr:MAG: ABC transporter ATP-binding protein [Methanophagales archaeon ANME-1-THS]
MGAILRVQGLCKRYELAKVGRELVALDKVSFEVKKGETVGIIGRSGAGKTTLLRMLRGYEKFDEGVIELDDVRVTPDAPNSEFRKLQEKTAFHLQRSFALYNISVIDNVIKRLRAKQVGFEEIPQFEDDYEELKQEAFKILDLVGLRDKWNHLFTILSGGDKQRVLLARQLAKGPSLLLLDEPGTMSDPLTRQYLLDSVKRVKERTELSILLVSHMPQVHRYLCDRMLMLEKGKVVDEGEPERVIEKFLAPLEPVKPLTPVRNEKDTVLWVDGAWKKYDLVTSHTLIRTIEMQDINIKVPRGDILGIIGPSAMGKTVLMRLLSGFEMPDNGYILIKIGTVDYANIGDYGARSIEARSKLGIVHQEFALPPHQLVLDLFAQKIGLKKFEMVQEAMERAKEFGISNVTLDILLRLADMSEEEAKGRLSELGLDLDVLDELFPRLPAESAFRAAQPYLKAVNLPEEIFTRYISETSMGEEIRLAIAALMASNCEILLLDEPFGDIDPISLRIVTNSLKDLNREFNTTMLVVSHQLDIIRELVHEAILIDEGKVVMRGNPDEVCDAFVELRFKELE